MMMQTGSAERILDQYSGDTPEEMMAGFVNFCANVLHFAPYPHQLFYALESFKNPYVLCVAPPRSGKTNGIEAVDIYETACYPLEDGVIYAPKYDQAKESLSYHYDWIAQSPLLKAFLRKKNGKPMFSSEGYQFQNMSNWKLRSIMGEIEGHNVTIMRPEEFDDWQWELFSNVVMRRGGAKPKNGKEKRIRVTGTIMGKENIYRLENDEYFKKEFKNLSWMGENRLDVHYMLASGVMDEKFVKMQKASMSLDEWARSMLLLYTESTNFIWSAYLRKAMKASFSWNLNGEPYVKGGSYNSGGARVVASLDCGHAGTTSTSSKYSLQVVEEINLGANRYYRWINGFNFDPNTDPDKLVREITDILAFYRVEGGYSDALNMTLAKSINQSCWLNGLTDKNPDDFPEQTPGNWNEWFLSPMWNNGKNKHLMFSALQQPIHQGYFFFPYYDNKDDSIIAQACHRCIAQILNIRQEVTNGSYPAYVMAEKKIGDDDADALGMCMKWFSDHPIGSVDFSNFSSTGNRRDFTRDSSMAG